MDWRKIEEQVIINKNTPCNPNSFMERSKLEAENEINKLGDNHFSIAIIELQWFTAQIVPVIIDF